MSHRDHLNTFRKQIRRAQLQQIFQSRRIKLIAESQKMQAQEMPAVRKEEVHRMDLKGVAVLSQSQAGIDIINEANYHQFIIKFLQSQFLNTDQQLYASYVLCNLSVKPKTTPNYSYLQIILDLLEQVSNQKVMDNLLCILSNTMCDYKPIRDELVSKYSLVDRILAVFYRTENATIGLCASILNCVLHMLNKSQPQIAYKKLRQFLIRFLRLQIKEQNIRIFKITAYSLSMLTKMYPVDLLEFLIKGEVFQRLIQLFNAVKQYSFASFVLRMGEEIVKDIKTEDFLRIFIKFIEDLSNNQFQIKTSNHQSKHLKRQSYKLINLALQLQKLQANAFLLCNIGKRMLEEFLVEQDKQILKELIFIFTNIYFNTSNTNVLRAVQLGMMRAKEVDRSIQIVAHIEQLQALFRT